MQYGILTFRKFNRCSLRPVLKSSQAGIQCCISPYGTTCLKLRFFGHLKLSLIIKLKCCPTISQNVFGQCNCTEVFLWGEENSLFVCIWNRTVPEGFNVCLTKVKGQGPFVVSFDESLNKKSQKKQMDIHIRFWGTNKVITRYFGSQFLGKYIG